MIATPDSCEHLDLVTVHAIHDSVIASFGGAHGIRDAALLESAVAAPQATFGGTSVYADLVEVAGAYLFFLCRNHPFLDGNKRVALASCLVFLRLNGCSPRSDGPHWEELTLDVAASRIDRDQTTARLRSLIES